MADKHGEREAKKIIGDQAWNLVMNAVSGGRINKEQLRDLVWFLPTDREKNKLGGNHDRRMSEMGTQADEERMIPPLALFQKFIRIGAPPFP